MLGEKEALQRLELLAATGRILDTTLEDFDLAMVQVAEACVADFADMLAIEVIGSDGVTRTAAYRHNPRCTLRLPERWTPLGRLLAPDRRPVLTYPKGDETDEAQKIRYRLRAQSMIAVPIAGGGLTLGWLVAATGETRRGFRPSALSIGAELGARLSNTIQRAMLLREMQASVREQTRTVRRLRRLATAATNLAGAATPQTVLDVACFESCVIHDAGGAVARWVRSDGTVVAAESGRVDRSLAEQAFAYASSGRPSRGDGWVAYPLPTSDPWEQASLVVFVGDDFATEEELVLSSLVSLVPVAFERAAGTEAAMIHESRLRAVVEGSPVALVGIDARMRVTMANRKAQELFGWTSDPVGLPLHGEIGTAISALADTVLSSGETVSRTASSHGLDLSLTGAPLPGPAPHEAGSVLVAGLDLTDIRRAERTLVQAQRLEAMGQVAGRVAHDFNNVLTLIVGYAELLRQGLDDQAKLALIDNIDQASRRAAGLTQQMLGMTRRRVEPDAWVDVAEGVSALAAVMTGLVGPGIDLSIATPGTGLNVGVDPAELEQIVLNLVINACDALGGSGVITVSAERRTGEEPALSGYSGDFGVVTVTDDGPGMSPEVLSRCLEPFYTTKPKGQGSGLGLPTVYGLVTDAGGRVEIESAAGAGTEVRVWLPLLAPEDDAVTTPVPQITAYHGGLDSSAVTHSPRVLLVEDDPLLLLRAERVLGNEGFDVVAVSSAEEAIDWVTTGDRVDLLVTDVMLPGMAGPDLVDQLRRADPTLPVVYMTGDPVQAQALVDNPRGDPVLNKPYTSLELRQMVTGRARTWAP
jgi:signal transduction histidine kinase